MGGCGLEMPNGFSIFSRLGGHFLICILFDAALCGH
jgi:hypothetical protein